MPYCTMIGAKIDYCLFPFIISNMSSAMSIEVCELIFGSIVTSKIYLFM
jgi:hypothetical protein